MDTQTVPTVGVSVFRVLTEREEEGLEKISSYSFARVREKLLKDNRLPKESMEEAITEFRKYLILILLGNNGIGMVSKEVDEVWHTFILFTKDYEFFCRDVFGSFVHHQPITKLTPAKGYPRAKFIKAYKAVFGPLPAIWNSAAEGAGECSPSTNCQDAECSLDQR